MLAFLLQRYERNVAAAASLGESLRRCLQGRSRASFLGEPSARPALLRDPLWIRTMARMAADHALHALDDRDRIGPDVLSRIRVLRGWTSRAILSLETGDAARARQNARCAASEALHLLHPHAHSTSAPPSTPTRHSSPSEAA